MVNCRVGESGSYRYRTPKLLQNLIEKLVDNLRGWVVGFAEVVVEFRVISFTSAD